MRMGKAESRHRLFKIKYLRQKREKADEGYVRTGVRKAVKEDEKKNSIFFDILHAYGMYIMRQ